MDGILGQLGDGRESVLLILQGSASTAFAARLDHLLSASAAAICGSPVAGGYAGAKRMQLFFAEYAQQESARLGLGLTFLTPAPSCLLPETAIGTTIAAAPAKYLGTEKERFLESLADRPTALDVARNVGEGPTDADNSEISGHCVRALNSASSRP